MIVVKSNYRCFHPNGGSEKKRDLEPIMIINGL